MKKVLYPVLIAATLLTTGTANALDCRSGIDHKHPACYTQVRGPSHGHHNHYRSHNRNHSSWVLPAIVGGIISYGVVRSMTPPPQVYTQPQYPPIYKEQLPAAPYGYHYQLAFDPSCNCNKYVLIPN